MSSAVRLSAQTETACGVWTVTSIERMHTVYIYFTLLTMKTFTQQQNKGKNAEWLAVRKRRNAEHMSHHE